MSKTDKIINVTILVLAAGVLWTTLNYWLV